MNRIELKNRAKESLKGKYGEAIKLLLITFAISFATGIVIGFLNLDEDIAELISSVVSFAVAGLLGFGTVSFFLKISRNETVTYKELFSKINMCFSYLAISLLVGLFTALWSLLLIIPGIISNKLHKAMYKFIKNDTFTLLVYLPFLYA